MLRKNIMGALALVACLTWASDAYGFGHSHGSHGSHGSSGGYSSGGYSSGGSSHGSSGGYSSGGYSSGGYSSGGRSHGSSGGYSSGSSGGYSSGGYSSGGNSSGGGLLRALFGGHRRHYYTSYGSSGGYSSGGYSSWGSHGGSSYGGSSGGYGGGYYSAPAQGTPAAPPSDLPAGEAAAASAYLQGNNAALISVTVPEGAEVYINDVATTSTGSQRRYISRGLQAGKNYTYRVTAKVFRNGKQYDDTQVVDLAMGQSTAIAFDPNLGNVEEVVPVSTTLIVKMPADAKLLLAGVDTFTKGESREFTTTHLTEGDKWESYVVRGELEVDGQTMVATQYVDLNAGDVKEIELNFADATVASRD